MASLLPRIRLASRNETDDFPILVFRGCKYVITFLCRSPVRARRQGPRRDTAREASPWNPALADTNGIAASGLESVRNRTTASYLAVGSRSLSAIVSLMVLKSNRTQAPWRRMSSPILPSLLAL